jgi:hypothetical protein
MTLGNMRQQGVRCLWFRYDAPDKRLFKQLQKTLTTYK